MTELLAFLLGVHLTMLLVATTYRVLDLWYCIARHAANIALRLCVVVTLLLLAYGYFGDSTRQALMAGQIFFVAFHIGIYWIGVLYLWWPRGRAATVRREPE
jgi:hypothetical protein